MPDRACTGDKTVRHAGRLGRWQCADSDSRSKPGNVAVCLRPSGWHGAGRGFWTMTCLTQELLMKLHCLLASFVIVPTPAASQDDVVKIDVKRQLESLASGNGQAALELAKAGEKAVPGLIAILGDGTPFAQGHAARALGRIGPQAKAAVPA